MSADIPVLFVVAVALVDRDGRVLLAERPEGKAMAGLWELPTRELLGAGESARGLWPTEFALGPWAARVQPAEALESFSHAITKHRIRGQLLGARWVGTARSQPEGSPRLVPIQELAQHGLTGLTRKCLERMQPQGTP